MKLKPANQINKISAQRDSVELRARYQVNVEFEKCLTNISLLVTLISINHWKKIKKATTFQLLEHHLNSFLILTNDLEANIYRDKKCRERTVPIYNLSNFGSKFFNLQKKTKINFGMYKQ